MRKGNANASWPPSSGRCPDGWEEDSQTFNKCYIPSDQTNTGTVSPYNADGTQVPGTGFMADDYATAGLTDSTETSWHLCGSGTITSTSPTTGTLTSNDNLRYFKKDGLIAFDNLDTSTNARLPIVTYIVLDVKPQQPITATNPKPGPGTLTFKVDTSTSTSTSNQTASGSTLITMVANTANPANYYGKRLSIDFNNASYMSLCNKKDWATAVGVTWDGVSNYNQCNN